MPRWTKYFEIHVYLDNENPKKGGQSETKRGEPTSKIQEPQEFVQQVFTSQSEILDHRDQREVRAKDPEVFYCSTGRSDNGQV